MRRRRKPIPAQRRRGSRRPPGQRGNRTLRIRKKAILERNRHPTTPAKNRANRRAVLPKPLDGFRLAFYASCRRRSKSRSGFYRIEPLFLRSSPCRSSKRRSLGREKSFPDTAFPDTARALPPGEAKCARSHLRAKARIVPVPNASSIRRHAGRKGNRHPQAERVSSFGARLSGLVFRGSPPVMSGRAGIDSLGLSKSLFSTSPRPSQSPFRPIAMPVDLAIGCAFPV